MNVTRTSFFVHRHNLPNQPIDDGLALLLPCFLQQDQNVAEPAPHMFNGEWLLLLKRDPIAFFATHRHNAQGANDIYAYGYVFRYTLDVPAGAKMLTLPKNPAIRIFAITAASATNDAARPVQYLYDAFETAGSTPDLSPAGVKFSDTTSIALRPSVYDTSARLLYTTDGTEPVASSAVYQAPIRVSHDTVIRARLPRHQAGRPGGVGHLQS